MHRDGFVKVISSQPRYLPEWAPQTSQGFANGYSINFADMQRMHIRRLQARLIHVAVSLDSSPAEWKTGGKGDLLGPLMREYGTFNPTLVE
jgi:hypothetical protein